jgi:8-oxo-dGTP diphosphatase
MWEIHADTFDMQIWLLGTWTGSPADVAPDEHDAIAWFEKSELGDLRLAHDSYLEMFTKALAWQRT